MQITLALSAKVLYQKFHKLNLACWCITRASIGSHRKKNCFRWGAIWSKASWAMSPLWKSLMLWLRWINRQHQNFRLPIVERVCIGVEMMIAVRCGQRVGCVQQLHPILLSNRSIIAIGSSLMKDCATELKQ